MVSTPAAKGRQTDRNGTYGLKPFPAEIATNGKAMERDAPESKQNPKEMHTAEFTADIL